jgi:hypothetical protein
MTEHELRYRCGTSGLEHLGIPSVSQPYWYCVCGGWRKNRDLQGQPFEETAKLHWRRHVKDVAGD